MGQYVYLSFTKLTEKGSAKNREYWEKTWFPKHEEVCAKHGVKILKWGIPFGTVEELLYIYETDLPLAKYQVFRGDVVGISDERLFDYTKTTLVNYPW
jgi:hypothetical protein